MGGAGPMLMLLVVSLFVVADAQPRSVFDQLGDGIRQTFGGVVTQNLTLRYSNGPYRVDRDILVEAGATLTIQTGTELYFDPGVGIKVHGTLYAVGVRQARIKMQPYKTPDAVWPAPQLRLVDGGSPSQGRLEANFRDKWRAVCAQNTNWTVADFHGTCRTLGFGGGGFWRWFRRNNDTRPLVMPRPGCADGAQSLFDCPGFQNHNKIPLSENLCQGEDDVGVVCWGPPTFPGWSNHWKGLDFISAPYENVVSDPNGVGTMKQSYSRLEYVDILYAGYDNTTGNATAAIRVQGIAPFMNDLHVHRSALDGIRILHTDGPVLLANSTLSSNRGHGLAVIDTTDGRVFVNETRLVDNFGDGVWYRQRADAHAALDFVPAQYNTRRKRQSFYQDATPLINFCSQHRLNRDWAFPYLIEAFLPNGTVVSQLDDQLQCYVPIELPRRYPYEYNFQFMDITNKNHPSHGTKTEIVICRAGRTGQPTCDGEPMYRIPVLDGIVPQTVSTRNEGSAVLVGLRHSGTSDGRVVGDVRVKLRVHATVPGQIFYGLNISNSVVERNFGRGVFAGKVRDRLCLTNASISLNSMAGVLVRHGAANIWINNTRIDRNGRDGLNVTFVGGSVIVNGTSLSGNGLRGAAFHHNDSLPFLALEQGVRFLGRSGATRFYIPTKVSGNAWGGILVGNFCASSVLPLPRPYVALDFIELSGNLYHPAFEIHSCQRPGQPITVATVTGCVFEQSSGFGMRVAPTINMNLTISQNYFYNNTRALLIRNRLHPQLRLLPARVVVYKNQFKFNRGPFTVSVGLNEDAPAQSALFHQQNELRENKVANPYAHLNPRTTPYAALIVSSSNVRVEGNCFHNPDAKYEMATDLPEHAKWIDASRNNWGAGELRDFAYKIFDQFYRYNLAQINFIPFASTCNAQNPNIVQGQTSFVRQFREGRSGDLGGMIYGNADLGPGTYTVRQDLHILPGARVSIAPGAEFQFENGIGMLVQGELMRLQFRNFDNQRVLFTSQKRNLPVSDGIRLVSDGNAAVTEGRLEVRLGEEWGTVCNRSWTVHHAAMACHQLGLVIDPEYLENWVIYPPAGQLPMLMDNIWCEEGEWDIRECRHDGVRANLGSSCAPSDVVGLRCVEAHWAGVRYSLLANPPLVTGQRHMEFWTIEKAGLFDFALPEFSAALQLDWNYHNFEELIIRDNFWNGLDIVYNDLTRKPTIFKSDFLRNRRHGVRLRSVGLTLQKSRVLDNINAGIRYNPIISSRLQKDVVTWLLKKDMTTMEGNHVFVMPRRELSSMELGLSAENSRRFLVAQATDDCPADPTHECVYTVPVSTFERGGHIAVQVVNRASNESDEEVVLSAGGRSWSVRDDLIRFPLLVNESRLSLRYTRSRGPPAVVLLLLYMGRQEYVDRFVHVYLSEISGNAYGVSTLHYSNFTHWDGSTINRWEKEKLWFQKTDFRRNKQAVVWVNGPLRDVGPESPIAEIEYKIDNCSVVLNHGSVIETHRDLHSSANVFHWDIWSSTFRGNRESGVSIALPEPFALRSAKAHSLRCTESRFYNNLGFEFSVRGFFAAVNISSNNFTENHARPGRGLIHLRGMEKELVMERNRWLLNQAEWIVKVETQSHSLSPEPVPARIRYNYLEDNWFRTNLDTHTIINWPRSFAIGLFGVQNVDVNYNRLNNILMDFECVVGLKPAHYTQTNDVTLNWWGELGNTPQGLLERVFDFDDWNSYMMAQVSPYFVTEEKFIDWWWRPALGQKDSIKFEEPSIYNLRGRMYESKTLERQEERWPNAPFYVKPQRPYLITHDLTIMPGATLTINKGVSVHLLYNVRILVLGSLVAEGAAYNPIRIRPLNSTELSGLIGSSALQFSPRVRRKRDIIARKFPTLARQDGFYQKFEVSLVGANLSNAGFLEIYNATTGEMVPICDRQFTRRNAQVVCRELGQPSQNVYSWVGPRWSYDPRIRLVKSYSEPRQCFGTEARLSQCDLRLNGDRDLWYCSDALHFVFVHCAADVNIRPEFVGHYGGIVFSAPSLEASQEAQKQQQQESILRHVEIFGGGRSHNESTGAALSLIYRSPTLQSVNVTNSSRDGVLILAPRSVVELSALNVSDNAGLGLNIVGLNLQSSVGGGTGGGGLPDASQGRNMSLPYNVFGMLDLCSVGRNVTVRNRVLVYFKYDSFPVDCVKFFQSEQAARKIGFRLLQVNLYNVNDPAGRPDTLQFYSSKIFSEGNKIGELNASDSRRGEDLTFRSPSSLLGLHLRANAANGGYGLVAEVASLPASPDQAPVRRVSVSASRFLNNDRGGLRLSSSGETSPDVFVQGCYFGRNGRHIWGNFSTSSAAVHLKLHNTQKLRVAGSVFWRNQGGLRVEAGSSTARSRLEGLVKDCAFAQNEYFETLLLRGVEYQKMDVTNCVFAKNRARYHDIVLVERFIGNFSRNTFFNNTGTHIVDMTGYPGLQTEFETFVGNWLYDNIALGHGYQFSQRYGYLPPAERSRRGKRQATIGSDGTSFDWWAHVGAETGRYRSTILAGSARQHYTRNLFANPLNDFELTTVNKTELDGERDAVDAAENFWGYPGTDGVASGKIRDEADYRYLLPVRFRPVLASNGSLVQGSCPPGWLQAGDKEFRGCYLLVPGHMDYHSAVHFCQDQDAILPYFSPSDPQLADITQKVSTLAASLMSPHELTSSFPAGRPLRKLWYSGVAIPTGRCGAVDTVTGDVSDENCGSLLPFVCGTGSQQRPFLWTAAGWAVVGVAGAFLLLLICLGAGWYHKSRRRKQQHFQRKASLRESIRSNKIVKEYAKQRVAAARAHSDGGSETGHYGASGPGRPRSPADLITAHRTMLAGKQSSDESFGKAPLDASMTSLGTTLTDASPAKPKQAAYSNREPSDYGSGSFYSSVPNFASAASTQRMAPPGTYAPSETGTLNSFRPDVRYRDGTERRGGRRHDTNLTEATTTTVTCSTCPTDSTFSYDPSGASDSRYSRGTAYSDDGSFSDSQTARSSATLTATMDDDRGSVQTPQPAASSPYQSPSRRPGRPPPPLPARSTQELQRAPYMNWGPPPRAAGSASALFPPPPPTLRRSESADGPPLETAM